MNDARSRRLRDKASGTTTLISQGCKIRGEISGECNLQVSGEVDGNCELTGTVTLLESGQWQGSLKATDIIIAGHVDGDVAALGKVEIRQTAHIVGTVSADAIAVAEGAVVEGAMKTASQAAPLEFVEKRDDDEVQA